MPWRQTEDTHQMGKNINMKPWTRSSMFHWMTELFSPFENSICQFQTCFEHFVGSFLSLNKGVQWMTLNLPFCSETTRALNFMPRQDWKSTWCFTVLPLCFCFAIKKRQMKHSINSFFPLKDKDGCEQWVFCGMYTKKGKTVQGAASLYLNTLHELRVHLQVSSSPVGRHVCRYICPFLIFSRNNLGW